MTELNVAAAFIKSISNQTTLTASQLQQLIGKQIPSGISPHDVLVDKGARVELELVPSDTINYESATYVIDSLNEENGVIPATYNFNELSQNIVRFEVYLDNIKLNASNHGIVFVIPKSLVDNDPNFQFHNYYEYSQEVNGSGYAEFASNRIANDSTEYVVCAYCDLSDTYGYDVSDESFSDVRTGASMYSEGRSIVIILEPEPMDEYDINNDYDVEPVGEGDVHFVLFQITSNELCTFNYRLSDSSPWILDVSNEPYLMPITINGFTRYGILLNLNEGSYDVRFTKTDTGEICEGEFQVSSDYNNEIIEFNGSYEDNGEWEGGGGDDDDTNQDIE